MILLCQELRTGTTEQGPLEDLAVSGERNFRGGEGIPKDPPLAWASSGCPRAPGSQTSSYLLLRAWQAHPQPPAVLCVLKVRAEAHPCLSSSEW